ncbi:cation:dicarboxylate symporter family transporter [Halobacillus amylolyticus]|uniref:L-cystine uptake protein TcyP n=1 Tax=Halobacillus amylolyticus TaxID=2932259 RepID=A0ABY4HJV7_9BACI|nr:cation:dicarboxylase symporter family transporter [Halobacillus amylolyticus]UOR14190.1 cation:dicarboxylase symporter family transporter [Halobacillus amylolyticus]
MELSFVLLDVGLFGLLMSILVVLKKIGLSFSKQVTLALLLGVLFGALLHWTHYGQTEILNKSLEWIGIVGYGYVDLLKMLIMPLIFVSIVMAFVKSSSGRNLGKMSFSVIGMLIGTTAIAAIIGIGASLVFDLDTSNLRFGEEESIRSENLETSLDDLNSQTIPDRIRAIIPQNPFLDFTGSRSTSTIAVVIFSSFIGLALMRLEKTSLFHADKLIGIFDSLQRLVLNLVKIIISFTPYGVMALMTNMVALSNWNTIWDLGKFLIASYIALGAMFIVHLIILAIAGVKPMDYIKKVSSVLTFSFSSRSSAAALPMNVKTQKQEFNVSDGIANFSGSFGLSIGQNGCAGIYPAMLAVMIAPSVNIDPTNPTFLINLVIVVAISSFGVVGVGGGATLAALIVLSTLNLPVGLAGLLISIEPLIDMGRTALNVSGSMTAGITTNRVLKKQ